MLSMLNSLWATVHEGQIQLSMKVDLPEGTRLLVTVLPNDDDGFWLVASESSLAPIWNNADDDAYGQLLKE